MSSLGRVRSLDRVVKHGRVKQVHLKGVILRQAIKKKGYMEVGLTKNGKQKSFKVHRLVATAFIHNTYNLPQINHKDEHPSNNFVGNLEWCDNSYNVNYGKRNERLSEKVGTSICQYTINGVFVKKYPSIKKASVETGIHFPSILNASKMKDTHKTAGGYVWILEKDEYLLNERLRICQESRNKQHKTIVFTGLDGMVKNTFYSLTEAHNATRLAKSTLMRYIHKKNICPNGRWDYL